MARQITGGATNVSATIRIVDSADGTPETGVVAATAGLVLQYRRELAVPVSLATITNLALLTTAHTDKGILHIGDGYYRVDVPDAAFAAGVDGVLITGTATSMVVIGEYFQIEDHVAIADAILDRDMSVGTDSGSTTFRTMRQALRFLRNKWSITGTALTVTKEDDATASWTSVVTTDAAADPITANDPAG